MKLTLHTFCALFLLGVLSVKSQSLPNRGCGADILPQQYEAWVQSITPVNKKTGGGQTQSIFNIPVIVHVVHNNEPLNSVSSTTGGNLNAAQIADQINILNKDFNGTNADTVLIPPVFKNVQGKFQFNFCLAVVNPTGGILAEPGIDRINRQTMGWTAPPYARTYIDGTIKPNSIWDPTRYLNMWVCDISGTILGYATFPNPGSSGLQGLSGPFGTATTDGLVMRSDAFGSIGTAVSGAPYNLGRTTTHEIGHWLGLRHIWGDGSTQCSASDFCNDTPPAMGGTNTPLGANYGCPTFPLNANTCTLGGFSNPNGDMFMNYMDYTNDACMYMFTKDQKYRAQLIMTNSPMRATLLTSSVCNAPTTVNDIGIVYIASPTYSQVVAGCVNNINPSIVIHNYGSNTITSAQFTINVDGVNTINMTWPGSVGPGANATVNITSMINNLSNGPHVLNVGVFNPNGQTDPNMSNNTSNQYFSILYASITTIVGNTVICQGSSTSFTANGSAAGYTWSPGALHTNTASFNPTVTTVYTVAAASGSCSIARTLTISVNPSTICVGSGSVCLGNSLFLNPCGGVSYTVNPGLSTTVTPTVSTNYTVVGTTSAGCVGTAISTVNVLALPNVSINVNPVGGVCSGASATLTPTGACTYVYLNGGPVVTPLSTTVYSVTGTSCAGCVSTQTVSVPVTTSGVPLTIAASSPSVCAGSSVVLTAAGASNYTWQPGGFTTAIVTVTPNSNTTYSLTGSNGSCLGYTTALVSVVPLPTLTVNDQTICAGGSATLTASGANTYAWSTGSTGGSIIVTPSVNTSYSVVGSNAGCSDLKVVNVSIGAGISVFLNSNPQSVCAGASSTITASGATSYTWSDGSNGTSIITTPTSSTTYSVLGDAAGCTGTAAITVSLVAKPTLSFNVSPSATLCSASPVTITASGATTYSWDNGATTNSIVVVPAVNTTYSVSGFGACQADSSVSIYLGVAPPFSISASPSFTVCKGQSIVLNANGPYSSYNWSSPPTSGSSVVVTPSVSTSYTVSASGSGCNTSSVVNITVNAAGPVSVLSLTNAGCNSSCVGAVDAVTSGGTAPYTYSLSGTTCTSLPCSGMCPGLYTMYTYDANNCSSFKIFSIQSSTNTMQSSLSGTNSSCATCADGFMNAQISGGLAPYSYSWSPAGGTAAIASGLSSGCYTVYVSDAAGCSTSARSCISTMVGLEQVEANAASLWIYPNPASEQLTVEYANATFDCTIFNCLGQIVSQQKNINSSASFNLEHFAKGVYVVEAQINLQQLRKKLVVE